jgi:pimeloyl-ACP methyl ester carboxylesterase
LPPKRLSYKWAIFRKEKIMDTPIDLFKTPEGQARYFASYDAALQLWQVPHESQFITTPYGKTHVISCGPKEAHPLLLLHAGQASSTMWFPNIALLSEKYHVFALDTPGEPGKSVPSRRNNTRSDCSAWLEGVMDELGISKAHAMGLSRGGWLALNLALYAPARLEKIILLSPAAVFIALNSFFSAVVQAVMRVPTRSVAKIALKSWVSKGFVVDPVFAEQFTLGLLNWNWKVNQSGYSGVMPSTFSDEELRQIRQPVLMLIGDQDRINPPKSLERARGTVPNLEGEVIMQAGHFLNMEQPESVNSRVLKFLAS